MPNLDAKIVVEQRTEMRIFANLSSYRKALFNGRRDSNTQPGIQNPDILSELYISKSRLLILG